MAFFAHMCFFQRPVIHEVDQSNVCCVIVVCTIKGVLGKKYWIIILKALGENRQIVQWQRHFSLLNVFIVCQTSSWVCLHMPGTQHY